MGKDAADAFRELGQSSQRLRQAEHQPWRNHAGAWPSMASRSWATIADLPIYASEVAIHRRRLAVSQYFVPADKVLVAASGLQGTLAYAGIVQVDEAESRMEPYEGARVPLVYYEKGYDFRKVRLSSSADSDPRRHHKLDRPRRYLILWQLLINLPANLGDILGAHHDGNFQTQVREIKAGIGVLTRGTILATGTAGDIGKLVKLTAGTEAQAYGVLLDPSIDTAAAFGDGSVTGFDRQGRHVPRAGAHRSHGRRRRADRRCASRTRHLRRRANPCSGRGTGCHGGGGADRASVCRKCGDCGRAAKRH